MSDWSSMLLAVFFHEMGHLLTARLLGIPLRRLGFCPLGGVMHFDFSDCSYGREGAVHLGGPLLGLVSGLLGWLIGRNSFFLGISVVLSMVNLLPIRGLDGGGILRCVLYRVCLPETAWRWCGICSGAGVLLLWTAVLWVELRVRANLGLLAFAVVLLLRETGATEE